MGEPDQYLSLAKSTPSEAEKVLLDFIRSKGKELAGSSVRARLAATKSFLDYYDVPLSWTKIKRFAPEANHSARDRAPTVEEIRRLLEFCGPRERAMILVLATSGIRVGAFRWLKVKDYSKQGELGVLRVYAGEPEEYLTLISPEAVRALDDYLELRRRTGESLGADSSLFRNRWDYQTMSGVRRTFITPERVKPLKVTAVQAMMLRLWRRAGLSGQGFKSLHGFRKFFKTRATKGITKDAIQHEEGDPNNLTREDVEALMGHRVNYYRPTLENLAGSYAKAVPYLAISEVEEAKKMAEAQGKEQAQKWQEIRTENLELKDKQRKLEETAGNAVQVMLELKKDMESQQKQVREMSMKLAELEGRSNRNHGTPS